ncbi:MAG: hypothetical protein NXI27_00600 [Alphaproteobacteria bacterium]|nr:hypothetical protein [Alphaproteobacteria bacterium]
MHHNGYLMHKKPGCLSGGISGVVSRIEAPSQPKIGTFAPTFTTEFGVAIGAGYINRYGFETELEKTIDGPSWSPGGFSSSYYISTKFVWARDESSYSGSRTNTTSGQYSGVTLNTSGSTFGNSSIGGGVVGNGSSTNSWHIGSVGFGANFIPDGDRPNHSFAVEVRPFWERIKFDSNGYAEVQYLGSLYNNIYQSYGLDTQDNYYGTSIEARAYMTPHWCDYVVFDIGGRVDLAYHEGKGTFWQNTNAASSQYSERHTYRESGFTVGGGITGGATIKVPEHFRFGRAVIRAEIDYSVLPDVTSFNFRGAPNDPAGSFTQKNLDRFTGTVGLKIPF